MTTTPISPPGQALATITVREQQQLVRLERIIDKGLQTFVEVGKALIEIRDQRFYREHHATFQDYCRERWHFSDSRARQLIAGAKLNERVETVTRVTVPTEAVARQLNRLPEDQQPKAWQEVVDKANGEPTATITREVVDNRLVKSAPCPNCGSTEREDDEEGEFCRTCKEPLDRVMRDNLALLDPQGRVRETADGPAPETEIIDPEPPTGARPGVGIIRASEAINCLIRIPKNDPLRKRGFQIVTDWIKHNP